jgi:hypothetical protein
MKIEYDLTPDDWADFGEYCARTAPEFHRARRNSIIVSLITVAVASIIIWLTTRSPTIVLCAAIFGLAGAILWPDRLVSHARSHMQNRERPCLTGRHVLEASPEALTARCNVTESSTKWVGVHRVAETPRHVFVMLNEVQGYVIPKARICEGDLRQFTTEAQKYASASPLIRLCQIRAT